MAAYEWVTSAEDQCIHKAIGERIAHAGFEIDNIGTTPLQVSAHRKMRTNTNRWSVIKLIATWSNKTQREILIEVRSDEPTLRTGTYCENSAISLKKLLPEKI